MSSATATKRESVSKRSTQATAELRALVERDNLKLLSTALAEAAIAAVHTNPSFLNRIREIYDELASSASVSKPKGANKPPALLIPISAPGEIGIGPNDALDPYKLQRLYGNQQLRQALEDYTLASLKVGAEMVMKRNPNTKPKSKSRRDDVIDYIVEFVTHGR